MADTPHQGADEFATQQPFVVTEADLANRHWGGGRGAVGLACGFCLRVPEVGETWRWIAVPAGASNTFVCPVDDGPDVVERFQERWATVIGPILRRWGAQ